MIRATGRKVERIEYDDSIDGAVQVALEERLPGGLRVEWGGSERVHGASSP